MTKQEAEQLMLAYREVDEDTGKEYGYQIIEYFGEHSGVHYFKCVDTDTKNPKPEDCIGFEVYPDGFIISETL